MLRAENPEPRNHPKRSNEHEGHQYQSGNVEYRVARRAQQPTVTYRCRVTIQWIASRYRRRVFFRTESPLFR